MEVGSKLKTLRKAKKYTTIELAKKVEVSQAYISQIENDKASPNLDMLNRILEALDYDLSWFFSWEEDETSDEDLIQLFQQLRALKPEMRAKIIELIEIINKEEVEGFK